MDIIFVIMFIAALVVGEQGDNTGDVFLLYTDVIQDTVGTMSVDGWGKENCLPSGTFNHPSSITYDQNSNTVYLVDNPRDVYKFTLEGQSSQELIYQDTSAALIALALDTEGHIFITNAVHNKITRININGTDPVDWVTAVDVSYGILVDTTYRYLIWSDYNSRTVSRASLDDPLSTVTVIIKLTSHPYGLHIDTNWGKLFWCEFQGRVMTANTDGSDVEVIVDIANPNLNLYGITGYGGHIYVTDVTLPYIVYDIYNGSYKAISNSTTLRQLGITVVKNQIPSTVCNKTCQNGGTVDADMCICDCLPHWSGDQCEECILTCQNGGTFYNNTCTCECKLQFGGGQCEILQQPTPIEKSPEIVSSSPSFGPAAGGTWITFAGTNFPLEYNISITIADITCDTKLQNTTTVIGITKGLPENDTDLIERPLPVSLKANNTVIVDSEYAFTYKKNPVISKVFPTESIIKGGTLLTVDGDNLDSVAVIWMEVSMILKTLKSDEPLVYDETRTTYATKCQEANSTRMFCPTPVLDVPSGFLNQVPQSTQTKRDVHRHINIGKTNNVRSLGMQHFLSANPSSRKKRETVKLEFSNDGDILEFYIGFRLDGIREYENYTTIDIYTEPTFDFQSSTVMIFKAGERLSFNGEGCDVGITINDYRIKIGKEDCVDLELRSNSLSCYPPQTKPAMNEDESHTEDPQIIIHVGLNLKHFAGYLRYPDPDRTATSTKLPLHIIIPATVVPAIVIIIVIAAVYAVQRRRACCQRPE